MNALISPTVKIPAKLNIFQTYLARIPITTMRSMLQEGFFTSHPDSGANGENEAVGDGKNPLIQGHPLQRVQGWDWNLRLSPLHLAYKWSHSLSLKMLGWACMCPRHKRSTTVERATRSPVTKPGQSGGAMPDLLTEQTRNREGLEFFFIHFFSVSF